MIGFRTSASSAVLIGCVLCALGSTSARAQEKAPDAPPTPGAADVNLHEETAPQEPRDSTNPGQVPMDQLTLKNPQPGQPIVPAREDQAKRFPFLDDAKVSAQLRTYYF